jgi:DNA-binding response OmpR family regulator
MLQLSCPCCGHNIGSAAPLDAVQGALTGHMRSIFDELSRRPGQMVSKERLLSAMYDADWSGGPENAEHVMFINIHRMRKKIEPFGWTIVSRGRGRGNVGLYRLIPIEAGP